MEILIAIGFFLLGLLSFPLVMFSRARLITEVDEKGKRIVDPSNILNMYRVIGFIATRFHLLAKLSFPDGKRPFWFIGNDETENVDMLP